MSRRVLLAFPLLASILSACAERVDDIDRTQGNLVRKSDLDGEWYMLQTIVGVPPTTAVTFVGETGKLERIRWEIQKDFLVAYRSYELVPGAEAPSSKGEGNGRDNPVAAYAIEAHVDVRREYDTSTGEQSNVIVENEEDRMWWERDYVRVDWSQNTITNFDFIAPMKDVTSVAYFVPEEQRGPDAFYRERDATGRTTYFDVLGKLFVEPQNFEGECEYGDEECESYVDACDWYAWYGRPPGDCTSAEIQVRSSFSRVPEKPRYEPFQYDDHLMSRFGYFRNERFTYDQQRGVVDAGRQYMINRHDIWKADLDEDGTPIPLSERQTKTIPYYLSADFPKDAALEKAASETMRQWNDAARRAVAAARGAQAPAEDTIFVVCHTPVADGDPAACGEKGFAPRMGDLRYSALHWVDTHTMEGLLGYGPAATDPVTGEIISGKAYVYGAACGTWATRAVDEIRFFNDQLDVDELVEGKHFTADVLARLEGRRKAKPTSEKLDRLPIAKALKDHGRAHREERKRPYDPAVAERRMEAARAAGRTPMIQSPEMTRSVSDRIGRAWESLSAASKAALDPTRTHNPFALKHRRHRAATVRARGIDLADLVQPNLEGLVRHYAGRKDYDKIWNELRADIFASTAEHEVGHTMGLRHNFQGTYDSLNYFDEYWQLREENLGDGEAATVGDVYRQMELTDAQREGLMRQKQYSSIMDYGYSWSNDLNGLGKYDEAAFVFGYTSGTYKGADHPVPGYVEVFKKDKAQLGRAGELLTLTERDQYYEDSGLASINVLERYHYTKVARSFPSLDDFSEAGRKLMRYDEYLAARQADAPDRPVKVPYLFCSDEWEGGEMSCNVYDQGADPLEMAKTKIDQYRSLYWFVNYRRDRSDFAIWDPYDYYFSYVFLPLSDLFQAWWFAPYQYDDHFDLVYQLAAYSGLNLLSEVLTTPPYGEYCEGDDGRLIHLSDEPAVQGIPPRNYVGCRADGHRINVAPGVGRREFSRYDTDAGYYYEYKPLESGHYWTTQAAVEALLDADAYIIGADGDAGVYATSFHDVFPLEVEELVNGLLSTRYEAFAPRAEPFEDADLSEASVRYKLPSSVSDDDGATYDPEDGAAVVPEPTGGPVGLCEDCTEDNDCAGHTGQLGGVYCQPFAGEKVCLVDCTNEDACPSGTTCIDGNCQPEGPSGLADFRGKCDEDHPLGSCPGGSTCRDGRCESAPWRPMFEVEPTYYMLTDLLWYGMLLSTSGYSTRFNDNLNVFRPGGDHEVRSDPAVSERVEFTDPLRGVTYAAVQPRCDFAAPPTGQTKLCGVCQVDQQCSGFTGLLGDTYCVNASADDPVRYCLQDCTEEGAPCPAGSSCVDANCVPDGGCPPPPPTCEFDGARDTGAVQLVRRGQELARRYTEAVHAWESSGDDDLLDKAYTAQYELEYHVDLLETVVATYELFGQIY